METGRPGWSLITTSAIAAAAVVASIWGVRATLAQERELRLRDEIALRAAEEGEIHPICEFLTSAATGSNLPSGEPLYGEPIDEACGSLPETPPSVAVRRELVAQLAAHPERAEQIIAMWRATYTVNDWIDPIEQEQGQ